MMSLRTSDMMSLPTSEVCLLRSFVQILWCFGAYPVVYPQIYFGLCLTNSSRRFIAGGCKIASVYSGWLQWCKHGSLGASGEKRHVQVDSSDEKENPSSRKAHPSSRRYIYRGWSSRIFSVMFRRAPEKSETTIVKQN